MSRPKPAHYIGPSDVPQDVLAAIDVVCIMMAKDGANRDLLIWEAHQSVVAQRRIMQLANSYAEP